MNVAPVIDPVATVVICADTSNVDTVFVAGRIVKHNGQLVRVDLPRLLDRLSGARDYLLSQRGRHSEVDPVAPRLSRYGFTCREGIRQNARRRATT